jgi:peroxiredoxin
MWHMPGHIYSRLKRYRDAVWQQEASARVDHAHMMRDQVLPDRIHNFAHNNEWLIRNLIYVGRMHDAVDLAKNMTELPRHPKYNTLAKRGSTYYGRLRLFQVLQEYELWSELVALAKTPYLEPTDRDDQKLKRLRLLGRAWFAKGDVKQGDEVLAPLEAELKAEQAKRNRAVNAAEAAFLKNVPVAALKPRQKPDKRPLAARLNPARKKQWNAARSKATRPFDTKVRNLQQAVNEMKACKAAAAKDFKSALSLLGKAGGSQLLEKARLQIQAGDAAAAVKALQGHVKSRRTEVLPLAHLVEALWKSGKKDEAVKEFRTLRTVAGQADLDAPALARLAPFAAEIEWPSDWRTPEPVAKDFGVRPPLDSLGPFRWQPFKAADWTLKDVHGKLHSLQDYRGKPVVVIFYLGYGCLHCAEQLQAFAPKAEKFRKAGYSLIAISTDGQQQLQKSHDNYKKGKFPFPLVSDSTLDVFKKYRAYDDFEKFALHGTFVIDGEGYVRWQDVSFEPFMDPEFVLKEANRLLNQSVSHAAARAPRPKPATTRSGG